MKQQNTFENALENARKIILWVDAVDKNAKRKSAIILMMDPIKNKLLALVNKNEYAVWQLDTIGNFQLGEYSNNINTAIENYHNTSGEENILRDKRVDIDCLNCGHIENIPIGKISKCPKCGNRLYPCNDCKFKICEALCPESATLEKLKTYKDWRNCGIRLSKYLKPGDEVDDGILEIFIDDMPSGLPPVTYSGGCVQMGESWGKNQEGKPLHMTLEKIDDKWIYTGMLSVGTREGIRS